MAPASGAEVKAVGSARAGVGPVGTLDEARTLAGASRQGEGFTYDAGSMLARPVVIGRVGTLPSSPYDGLRLRATTAYARMLARLLPRMLADGMETENVSFCNEWTERPERRMHKWAYRLREREHPKSARVECLQSTLKRLLEERLWSLPLE